MSAKKLSPTQIALLRSVALGKVWRNDRGPGRPLYACYVEGERRNVSRTFDVVHGRGLVEIDFTVRRRPVATLTDAGRQALGYETTAPARADEPNDRQGDHQAPTP